MPPSRVPDGSTTLPLTCPHTLPPYALPCALRPEFPESVQHPRTLVLQRSIT